MDRYSPNPSSSRSFIRCRCCSSSSAVRRIAAFRFPAAVAAAEPASIKKDCKAPSSACLINASFWALVKVGSFSIRSISCASLMGTRMTVDPTSKVP